MRARATAEFTLEHLFEQSQYSWQKQSEPFQHNDIFLNNSERELIHKNANNLSTLINLWKVYNNKF